MKIRAKTLANTHTDTGGKVKDREAFAVFETAS